MDDNIIAQLKVKIQDEYLVESNIGTNCAITVGRDEHASISIATATISKFQCKFFESNHNVYIQDLNSKNGTFVNGKKITGTVLLSNNDIITIGIATITIIIPDLSTAESSSNFINKVMPNTNELAGILHNMNTLPETDTSNAKNDESKSSSIIEYSLENSDTIISKTQFNNESQHQDNEAVTDSLQEKNIVIKEESPDYNKSSMLSIIDDVTNTDVEISATIPNQKSIDTSQLNIHDKTTAIRNSQNDSIQSLLHSYPFSCFNFPDESCSICKKKLFSDDFYKGTAIFVNNVSYCISCACNNTIPQEKTINGYKIIQKLGEGGMGAVYEAIQVSMQRLVAFKTMLDNDNISQSQRQRFLREARVGGKLIHPNIVSFIDCDQDGSCYYLVMEYICGPTLHNIIETIGAIPYKIALNISKIIAEALKYADDQYHIVHRDIKPENILLNYNGDIKITDFGLAKIWEEAGESGITQTQTGIGTLYYMAPEQIFNAKYATYLADIYSLGVTMYEMLTTEHPFEAARPVDLIKVIQEHNVIPIDTLEPTIPKEVNRIVLKAMARNGKDRYQSYDEMIYDIEQVIQE